MLRAWLHELLMPATQSAGRFLGWDGGHRWIVWDAAAAQVFRRICAAQTGASRTVGADP
jgi:hypothetical protein